MRHYSDERGLKMSKKLKKYYDQKNHKSVQLTRAIKGKHTEGQRAYGKEIARQAVLGEKTMVFKLNRHNSKVLYHAHKEEQRRV